MFIYITYVKKCLPKKVLKNYFQNNKKGRNPPRKVSKTTKDYKLVNIFNKDSMQ